MSSNNWLFKRGLLAVCCGPALVGLVEALLVNSGALFATVFYGTAATLAGLGLLVILALFGRRKLAPESQERRLRLLAGLSLFLPALVIGKFLLFRNIFFEQREKNGEAWGIALLISLAAVLFWYFLVRFYQENCPYGLKRAIMLLPAANVIIFLCLLGGDNSPLQTVKKQFSENHPGGTILIIVDALRADAINEGDYPNIGQLKKGRNFTNVFSQASWTKPTMASIMTGKPVSGHHVMSKTAVLSAGQQTLAEYFKDRGYTTLAIANNANITAEFGFAQGFDEYRFLAPTRYFGAPDSAGKLSLYNIFRLVWERFAPVGRDVRHFYQPAEVVSQKALEILDGKTTDAPFFLYLHYMDTHDPYFAQNGRSYARVAMPFPDVAKAKEMRQAYQDELARFDNGLGILLKGLEERGLKERVKFILTADHGEEFAEHGGFYHGTTLYNEQIRVPLIFFDGLTNSQFAGEIDTMVSQAQIFSLVADWHGFDKPQFVQGSRHYAEEDHQGNRLRAVIDNGYVLIKANKDNPRGLMEMELYDLTVDEGELHNLGSARPELVEEMDKLFQEVAPTVDAASEGTLSPEQAAQLRALGYIE